MQSRARSWFTVGLRWYLHVGFAVRGANAVGTAGKARVLHGGKDMHGGIVE